jgi:sulfur oxidation c-type cytochrome SoxX
MKRGLATLALIIAIGAVLYFAVTQALSLWRSFARPPSSMAQAAAPDIYAGMTPDQVGKLAFTTAGCLACHNVGLQGGIVGSSLDNVADRRTDAAWLRQQITDPQAVVPGSYMPIFPELSELEIQGLIAYLHTLDPAHASPDNQGPVQLSPPPGVSMAMVQRGEELFKMGSCMGCHTINGVSQGTLGPNLTHEAARKRTDSWQRQHLINPLSVYVAGEPSSDEVNSWPMPPEGGMQLSDEDLQALVAYMQSLK